MVTEGAKLPDNVSELQELIAVLYKKLEELEQREQQYETENKLLRERISQLTFKIYGRKFEKFSLESDSKQGLLFPDVSQESVIDEDSECDEIKVKSHKRKRGGRKPIPDTFPRVEVVHDLSDEEKRCGCGCEMLEIGREESEQVEMTRPRFWVTRHIRLKYACKNCEGVESEGGAVKIASMPEQLIPRSICSASLLSHIVVSKFCDSIPLYRQEKQFLRYGIAISRAKMCHWLLKVWDKCKVLDELLLRELHSGPLINMDETSFQVISESGRSASSHSYMWVSRGGAPGRCVCHYRYSPSRSGAVARQLLKGYSGYVQTDGYRGYNFLDVLLGIIHVGCWSHTRRKFVEVVKLVGKKSREGLAVQALRLIAKLYKIEHEAREAELSVDELTAKRQKESKKIVDQFESFLKKNINKVLPESLLGRAFSYSLSQMPRLRHFLKDGRIPLDNNWVENAIRPFALGRKNWLFCYSEEGAHASALYYSLIETAKANGLDPYKYMRYLFENLPAARTEEDYKKLLPQYVDKDQLNKLFEV
jgi:transposase